MSKKCTMEETNSGMVSEPVMACAIPQQPLHLDVTLESDALVADIKKALKMIRGIAAVRVSHALHREDNVITPALARKIEKARKDYSEGRYTECKTEAEQEAFLEAL